jgi:hypothetical protein
MIDKVLAFITGYINQEIKMSFGLAENKVIASSLINPDGSVTEHIENKIIISVINLEHETTTKYMGNFVVNADNQYGKVAPPVYLNIYLLFSANYMAANYMESLKMLSAVIGILQAVPYFERSDFPDMDPSIDKLAFEIFNVPINELSHIWSGIGAKYVPSIIYKVRLIAISKNLVTGQVSGVSGLERNSSSQ